MVLKREEDPIRGGERREQYIELAAKTAQNPRRQMA